MTQKRSHVRAEKERLKNLPAVPAEKLSISNPFTFRKFYIKVVVVRKGDNCARTSRRQTASVISWTLHLLIIIISITTLTLYDAFWTIGPRDPHVCGPIYQELSHHRKTNRVNILLLVHHLNLFSSSPGFFTFVGEEVNNVLL